MNNNNCTQRKRKRHDLEAIDIQTLLVEAKKIRNEYNKIHNEITRLRQEQCSLMSMQKINDLNSKMAAIDNYLQMLNFDKLNTCNNHFNESE